MIVYSVTTSVLRDREEEWLDWMHGTHIPDVMATGYFQEYHLHKLLNPTPDPQAVTYNVQYLMESLTDYHHYTTNEAPALREQADHQFGQDIQSFRTVLRRVV
jgi:hypothetical protein